MIDLSGSQFFATILLVVIFSGAVGFGLMFLTKEILDYKEQKNLGVLVFVIAAITYVVLSNIIMAKLRSDSIEYYNQAAQCEVKVDE